MSYEERVKRGAALLDKKYPGWADRIELDRLDLGSCTTCVLGQLYQDQTIDQYVDDDDEPDNYGAGVRVLGLGGENIMQNIDDEETATPNPKSPQWYGFNLIDPYTEAKRRVIHTMRSNKGFTVEMIGRDGAGPENDPEEYGIYLGDEDSEIVAWTGTEWIEDPTVVASIVNAIMMGVIHGPDALRESIA